MALKAHAREMLYFDFLVKRRAQHAPFPKLRELVNLWKRAADEKLSPKAFDKGDASCIINDVRIDDSDDTAVILLSVADKRAPDSTYGNHDKRTSRTVEKLVGEGNEHSAHIVVSLKPRPGHPETYACMIERVPTLSTARMQSMLNDVVKKYCEKDPRIFEFSPPSGAKEGGKSKKQAYIPNILLAGNPSAAFERDVEEGKINGLRLIRALPKKSLGTGSYLETTDEELKVKVKPIPAGNRWSTIKAAVKTMSSSYQRARIYLAPADGQSAASFEFDTDTGAIIGDAYVRRQQIGSISPLLKSATDKIVDHLVSKIKPYLLKERDT